MHRAAAKAKGAMPYRGAGAESEGKQIGQEAGAKVDSAVSLRPIHHSAWFCMSSLSWEY